MTATSGTQPDRRQRTPAIMVGVLLTLGATACNNDGQAAPTVSVVTPAATVPASASPDEQALVMAQYRKFWITLAPVSRMPAARRRAELAKVAVDPQLKSLLAGMVKNDESGEVFYGAHIPRATTGRISPDGATAVIDDCQDSTKTGLAKKSSMQRVTVGVARNHVVVTMKKQSEGVWKVAFVSYTKTPC